MYVVNRKSLMVNKTQVNYNDDSSNVLCAPLSVNMLKWSESFMGNAMMYDLQCKYEEPLRRIAFDFDCPKVLLFRVASNDYSFSPPSNTNRIQGRRIEFRDYDAMTILTKMKHLVQGTTHFCLRGLSIKDLPKRLDTCQYVERRAIDWANDRNDASSILWSDVISDIWSSNSRNLMRNENDEIISFDGLFGLCFGGQINFEHRRCNFDRMMQTYHHVDMEGVNIYHDSSCLLHHYNQSSKKRSSPLISFGTLNGKFAFSVMGNLSGNDFMHCPEMVMRDVIRMCLK